MAVRKSKRQRRKRTAAVPADLLRPVVRVFKPRRVILFGSRARGGAVRDSDFDLAVIVDDDAPPQTFALEARREARRRYGRAADIVPCRESVFRKKSRVPGSLAHMIAREGVVVYERP